ncbi:MAG TPA: mannosyltransferase family protein [Solirubrobacteraceae bacterium]|nr:mannosyltransferase family protein [Solirubrobacteraceae bacterium]
MSPDTAEMAVVEAPPAGAPFVPHAPPRRRITGGVREQATVLPGTGARPRRGAWARALEWGAEWAAADPARTAAVRDAWRAVWLSRALVWVAGIGTVATLGFGPVRNAFDPPGVTRGFGWLGDLLAAPAARWDASWYLVIAHFGYRPELGAYTSARDAFFPLYPLGVGMLSRLGLQPVLAGVLFSVLALGFALYALHRLTALEFAGSGRAGARDTARLAVYVTALTPMAFYFSAVYSESLYLALSVGVFWFARRGRWMWVGVLGALAAATRSTGVLLLAPAAMLYLYGPREDRLADFPRRARGLARRYRLRLDALWLALMPAGLFLYMAYLGLAGGSALAPLHSQQTWGRHFAGPYAGVWDGLKAAWAGVRQLASGQRAHVYYPLAGGSPFITAGHNLMLLAFLAAAAPLLVAVVRMLPGAYGVYAIAALALPLSYPVNPQPLMSLARFLVVLFPLSMVVAAWLAGRPRARAPVLVCSAIALMFFAAEFATWHWVA